jgi:hypothetical protein
MSIYIRDERGVMHVVHDASEAEIADLTRRAWHSNAQKAEEYGLLPQPIYGMEKIAARAAV